MQPTPVYILAGGRSSRFGSDKARAPFAGSPLILHIAQTLAPIASSITVVADVAGRYADLGLRTIADRTPGFGPLSGLDGALADLKEGAWLLLVSCDLAGIGPGWPEVLWGGQAEPPGGRAVAFRGVFWEPLFALYHASIHPEVARRLASRQLSMQHLLDAIGAASVPLPPDWPPQANTPSQLAIIANPQKEPRMSDGKKSKLPGTFKAFIEKYPALGAAHEAVAKAAEQAGPLDRKTCELIKIGLCVGAGLESALRSHVRRATQHGATEVEIEQAILLAMNTCGFPRTVAAWQWAQQQFERDRAEPGEAAR